MTSQHPGLLIYFFYFLLYTLLDVLEIVFGVYFSHLVQLFFLLKNKTTIFTIKPLQLQNVGSDYSQWSFEVQSLPCEEHLVFWFLDLLP